jgi:hypothetical protein
MTTSDWLYCSDAGEAIEHQLGISITYVSEEHMLCLLLMPRFLLLVRRTTVCCIKLMMPNTNIQPTPDKCASTEFGVTLIGKDGLVILAGAESVKSHQTHGFHWYHSGHYYEPSFHQQPPVVCMVHGA